MAAAAAAVTAAAEPGAPMKPSEPRSSHIVLCYTVCLGQNRISVGGGMREEESAVEKRRRTPGGGGGGGWMMGEEGRGGEEGGALMRASARNLGVLHFFFSANKKHLVI